MEASDDGWGDENDEEGSDGGWDDANVDSDEDMDASAQSMGMKKSASILSDGESTAVRIFNMDMLKNKFFKREIDQYHEEILYLTNDDEIISICRYFDWNREAISN